MGAAVVVAMVGGCSGGQADGQDPTAEVRAAYSAYWDVLLGAQSAPSEAADLTAVATGTQLRDDAALLDQRIANGETVTGGYDHEVTDVSVDDESATVVDCLTADLVLVTGAGEERVPPGPYRVTATLVLDDGTWKLSALMDEGTCSTGGDDQ